jgi:hypothetical protein
MRKRRVLPEKKAPFLDRTAQYGAVGVEASAGGVGTGQALPV